MKKIKMYLGMCICVVVVLLCGTETKAAQELEVNTSVQISTQKGTGRYQFTIEKQGKIELSAVPVSSNILGTLTLYEIDEDENELPIISYNGSTSIDTTPVRLPAGTYIIVYDSYWDSQQANLTIRYTEENADEYETEKNNTWSTANAIKLNREYTANLQSGSDVDIYQFNLEQEGSLYVNFRNIETNAYNMWKIALYVEDESGNHNLIGSWSDTTNKYSRFTRYRLPKGKYYIHVSSGGLFIPDDYSIGTTYVAETSADSEIEYNDSLSTANLINTNTEYKANIATIKDVDCFKFTTKKTSKVTIQMRQEADTITAGLYNVTLYWKDGNDNLVIYDRFNTTSNKVSKGHEVTIPKGTYIVYVRNNNGTAEDKNDYILNIIQKDTKEEAMLPGTPQDAAGKSGIPVAVNSTILVSAKEGRYLFMIPKDGIITLSATPVDGKTSVYGGLTLYGIDEDGNEIEIVYNNSGAWGNTSIDTTPVRLSAGTYIIVYDSSFWDPQQANLTIYYDDMSAVTKLNSSNVKLSKTSVTYNGKAQKPSVTVKDNNGNKVNASNYTVKYSNNKNVGQATVTVTFKGNYSGTAKKTFKIVPKGTSISKVSAKKKGFAVKWKKQTTQTTGYEIQYSTSSKFKGAKTVKNIKVKTTSKSIPKLKANKKYYVRIRTYKTVKGKKYYSDWSKSKKVVTKK